MFIIVYRSVCCFFFALKWRDWNFILRPRMLVPIRVGQTESDSRGRKRDRYPLALFPLLLPSSIPVGMKAERIGGMRKEG